MTSLPSAPELDQLTITIVVDNATDTLSSIAPGMPQLPEIAYLLGYSESSAFNRAYRRWTGRTPSADRRRAIA